MIAAILVALLIGLGLYKWWTLTKIPKRFPTGPLGLPLIGYPGLFKKDLCQALFDLHDEYGPIYSVNLGPQPRTVVIGSYDLLKKAFKEDSLTTRPDFFNWFNVYFRYGNGTDSRGLLFSSGKEWQEQRRFVLRNLRDFGFGKSGMEALIHDEILELFQHLDKDLGQPVTPSTTFNISVLNSLWRTLTGKQFKLDDVELQHIVQRFTEFNSSSSQTDLVQVFPSLRHILPEMSGWNKTAKVVYETIDLIKPTVMNHVKDHDQSGETKDLIDVFLNKIKDSEDDPTSSFHGQLGMQNLEVMLLDLLIAGAETTSTALTWSLLYLLYHPQVLAQARDEIDQVVGQSRLVQMNDKPNLPFCEALTNEILRHSSIAPTGLPHATSSDVILGDYLIPAGTTVFPNLFRILRDPDHFPNPCTFDPKRFLDQNGRFSKIEANIAFGVGKRDCLGQTLALTELFLFLTCLIQRYDLKAEGQLPAIEGKTGFIHIPHHYQVVLTKRNHPTLTH